MLGESFTEDKRKRFIELLVEGYPRYAAMRDPAIKLTEKTVRAYANSHPEFQKLIEEAESDGCAPIEKVLHDKAMSGNLTAIFFYLLNRSNGRWNNKNYHADESKGQVDSMLGVILNRLEAKKVQKSTSEEIEAKATFKIMDNSPAKSEVKWTHD